MQRRDEAANLIPLFDAVADAPDDDAPRHVLADALLDRGDVRGEFISLQLLQAAGKATPGQDARAKTLEDNHWRRWFIEVPGVGVSQSARTSLNEFHRGFLRSCVLSSTGVGADSPAWRMVERIDVADTWPAREVLDGSEARDAGELAAPALTRLEVLTDLDGTCLQVVLDGPDKPRLRELAFAGPWLQEPRGQQEQRQVLALTRFPSLKVLGLVPTRLSTESGTPVRHRADSLGWLFEAPLIRQLERLRLWVEMPFDVAGLHALLGQQRLDRLKVELANTGLTLMLDASRLTVRFDNEFWLGQRAQSMRNLAAHFAPFPYPRFDVQVGGLPATKEQLARLGDVFIRHAT